MGKRRAGGRCSQYVAVHRTDLSLYCLAAAYSNESVNDDDNKAVGELSEVDDVGVLDGLLFPPQEYNAFVVVTLGSASISVYSRATSSFVRGASLLLLLFLLWCATALWV